MAVDMEQIILLVKCCLAAFLLTFPFCFLLLFFSGLFSNFLYGEPQRFHFILICLLTIACGRGRINVEKTSIFRMEGKGVYVNCPCNAAGSAMFTAGFGDASSSCKLTGAPTVSC